MYIQTINAFKNIESLFNQIFESVSTKSWTLLFVGLHTVLSVPMNASATDKRFEELEDTQRHATGNFLLGRRQNQATQQSKWWTLPQPLACQA